MAQSAAAHRPSRRDDIVEAAISVFAVKGFAETSIGDISDAAGVAATAVYYHFAGKEDLFGAAISAVLAEIDAVVTDVRANDGPAGFDTLTRVIDGVWDWVDAHPERAQLVYVHAPSATRQVDERRRGFEDLHAQRALDYLGSDPTGSLPRAGLGTATLATRILVDSTIAIQQMRLPGGPLDGYAADELRQAVKAMCLRLMEPV